MYCDVYFNIRKKIIQATTVCYVILRHFWLIINYGPIVKKNNLSIINKCELRIKLIQKKRYAVSTRFDS